VGQGHLWLDWFQANVQLAGPVARMIGSLGEIGLFRYFYNSITCEHPEIVDWAKINAANQLVILTKMLDLRPNSGLFFDQAWRAPVSGYFCDPNTDVGQQCRPCATGLAYADYLTGATWTTNILNFYTLAKAACEARGLYLIKNGAAADFTTNGEHPIYIENADNFAVSGKTFDQWVTIWRQHPKNVLSVIVPTAYPGAPGSGTNQAVDRVCAAYRQYGGWVAFTGEIAQHSSITAAYAAIQAIGGGV
jgi:hypothetical protein